MRSGACSWAIRRPLPFNYALASAKSIASRADLSCTLCGKGDGGWATLSRHTEIPLRHAVAARQTSRQSLIADFIFLDPSYNDDGLHRSPSNISTLAPARCQGMVIASTAQNLDCRERLERLRTHPTDRTRRRRPKLLPPSRRGLKAVRLFSPRVVCREPMFS